MKIILLESYKGYNAGDLLGLPELTALQLIETGRATRAIEESKHEQPKPAGKPAGKRSKTK